MTSNETLIKQQVKNRIKEFNRQRIGAVISIVILMAFLLLSPMMRTEALSIQLAIFCCFSFFLLSLSFILSLRQASALFLTAAIFMGALVVLGKICPELFFGLILINGVTVFISQKVAHIFRQSVMDEMNTMNRLKIETATDSLTQLLNRNGLEQALEIAWVFCRRNQKRVGFLMVDIDYFKSYNDVLGHMEGDNILRQVADSIKMCCKRKTDIIGRMGGEEFLVVLSDIDDAHMVEMAQVLSSTVTNLKIKSTAEHNPCEFLSVSIGIATGIPQRHDLIIDLHKQADQALYHAKRSGRNCISFNGTITRNASKQNRNDALSNEAEESPSF